MSRGVLFFRLRRRTTEAAIASIKTARITRRLVEIVGSEEGGVAAVTVNVEDSCSMLPELSVEDTVAT